MRGSKSYDHYFPHVVRKLVNASPPYDQYDLLPAGSLGFIGGSNYNFKKYDGKTYFSVGDRKLIRIENDVSKFFDKGTYKVVGKYYFPNKKNTYGGGSKHSIAMTTGGPAFWIKGIVNINHYIKNDEKITERSMYVTDVVYLNPKWHAGRHYVRKHKGGVHQANWSEEQTYLGEFDKPLIHEKKKINSDSWSDGKIKFNSSIGQDARYFFENGKYWWRVHR